MTTCSIWPGSAFTCHRSGPASTVSDHILADQSAQHFLHVGDDGIEIEHDGHEDLLAAEGQKLSRECRCSFTGLADLRQRHCAVDLRDAACRGRSRCNP